MKKYLSLFIFLSSLLLWSCDDTPEPMLPEMETEQPLLASTNDVLDIFTEEIIGTSTLDRYEDRVEARIETTNLIVGHAYNIMAFIANDPTGCAASPCIFTDHQQRFIEIKQTVILVDGFVATTVDMDRAIIIKEGDLEKVVDFGDSELLPLQNAATADIILTIRSRGPAKTMSEAELAEQLTTVYGGCTKNYRFNDPNGKVPTEVGECAAVQYAQHVAN